MNEKVQESIYRGVNSKPAIAISVLKLDRIPRKWNGAQKRVTRLTARDSRH